MSDLVCPHCRNNVPRGATVCSGCQAEIEYGAPNAAFLVLLVVSAGLGIKASGVVSDSLSFLGWGVGIGVFIAGAVLITNMFGDRVVFKRIYRTK
jgi:hypothetical protein